MKRYVLLILSVLILSSCTGPRIRLYSKYVRSLDTATFTTATIIEKLEEVDEGLAAILSDRIPIREIKVESILYKTHTPQGESIYASGLIARPANIPIKGVISALHVTMTSNEQAPSEALFCRDILPAFLGYVVFVSDYLGLGQTRHIPQPYLHLESTANCQIDMVIAAQEYLKYEYDIDTYMPMYVEGYSQGGAIALNFMRVVQNDYSNDIKIKKVFCGGAPMDLPTIIQDAISTNTLNLPAGIALVVEGLNYSEDLNLDFSSIFTENMLSQFDELIRSKKYMPKEIRDILTSTRASDYLHSDFYADTPNEHIQRLLESGRRNSLTHGWVPDPDVPIFMIHSMTDDYVPYANIEKGVAFLEEAGAQLEFLSTFGSHTTTALAMYLHFWNALLAESNDSDTE